MNFFSSTDDAVASFIMQSGNFRLDSMRCCLQLHVYIVALTFDLIFIIMYFDDMLHASFAPIVYFYLVFLKLFIKYIVT